MSEHTKGKWYKGDVIINNECRIFADTAVCNPHPDDRVLIAIVKGLANAEYIVLACNEHESLIKMIKEIEQNCYECKPGNHSALAVLIADTIRRKLGEL